MTTYYVATNGNDSGNGTSGSPWRTISKAMKANLKPGDDVVVRSGTYKEGVVINKDGAAGNYITVRSEVPGGAKIVPPGEKQGVFINANYIKLDGFDVSGSKNSGIAANSLHHVNITNNIVHDNVSNGIFVGKFDFVTIEGNTVYGNAARGPVVGYPPQGRVQHHRQQFGQRLPDHHPRQRVVCEREEVRSAYRWKRYQPR